MADAISQIPRLPAAVAAKAPDPAPAQKDAPLWAAAQKLEANFLSEMLKSAGVGKPRESFGGGIGEDQFGSFLRELRAEDMVEAGGIGLAESLYNALKEKADAR